LYIIPVTFYIKRWTCYVTRVALYVTCVTLYVTCVTLYVTRVTLCVILYVPGVITLTGMVIAAYTLIFHAVYQYNRRVWILDDLFGLLCSLFLLCYGL